MTIKLLSFVALPLLTLVLAIRIWDVSVERAGQRVVAALSNPDPEVWSVAVERLQAAEPEALIRSFRHVSESRAGKRIASLTVKTLGDKNLEHVVPLLIKALGDGREKTRLYAAMTLAYLGTDALPAVIETLETSLDARVRTSAAWILSLMGPDAPSAIVALTAARVDPSKDVRYTATYSLHQLRTTTSNRIRDTARNLRARGPTSND